MNEKKLTSYERAINYLSQVEYVDGMITEKLHLLDSLRSSLLGKAIQTDGDRVQTCPRDSFGDTCTKICDLETEINGDIDHFVDMKMNVSRTLDQYVDNLKQRQLLYIRYLKFKAIPTAAREMHISERTAYRLHNRGICKVARKFEKP